MKNGQAQKNYHERMAKPGERENKQSRDREYAARPEVKAKRQTHRQTEESKVKRRAYDKERRTRPKVKAKSIARSREYEARPDVQEKRETYRKSDVGKTKALKRSRKYRAAHPERVRENQRTNVWRRRCVDYEYVYKHLVHTSKTRDLEVHFGLDEYLAFVNNNPACFYCDHVQAEDQPILGLDRVNNTDRFYALDLVVRCCKDCNTIKGEYALADFVHGIYNIVNKDGVYDVLKPEQLVVGGADSTSSFVAYAGNARATGRRFEFTKQEFDALRMPPAVCSYCAKPATDEKWLGVDRVDNDGHYTSDNGVSCCSRCNFMKGDINVNVWMDKCRQIYEMCHIGDLVESGATMHDDFSHHAIAAAKSSSLSRDGVTTTMTT